MEASRSALRSSSTGYSYDDGHSSVSYSSSSSSSTSSKNKTSHEIDFTSGWDDDDLDVSDSPNFCGRCCSCSATKASVGVGAVAGAVLGLLAGLKWGAAIGAAIGFTVGTVPGAILGAVIGAIIGAIVLGVVALIIDCACCKEKSVYELLPDQDGSDEYIEYEIR